MRLGENELAVGILLVGISKSGYFSRHSVGTLAYHFGHRPMYFWTVDTGWLGLRHETNSVYMNLCKLIWNCKKCFSVFGSTQCRNACDCVRFSFAGLHT